MDNYAFEDTYRAITRLSNIFEMVLEDDVPFEPLKLSPDEHEYYQCMRDRCQRLMDLIFKYDARIEGKK